MSTAKSVAHPFGRPRLWSEMTSQEVGEALRGTNVVLVPVGAIEQHAGHLPLGTDNYQAEEVARRAVLILAEQGKKVLVGPTIPFGTVADMRFPGSVNIRPRTMISLIKEVCSSLYLQGVRKIALILGHDENFGAQIVAAQELVEETNDELKVIVANWLPPIKEIETQMIDLPAGKRDAHGGAGETARMLWQYPDLVQLARTPDYAQVAAGSPTAFGHALILGGGVYSPRKVAVDNPTFQGIVGFPSRATADAGDRLYDAAGRWLANIVDENFF